MSSKQTVQVGTQAVEWTVGSGGMFHATMAGEEYEAESLKKLTEMLRNAAKKTPLNIPFVMASGHYDDDELEIRQGVVTGRHSGNHNLLGKWDDNGESGQLTSYGKTLLSGDVDIDRLKELHTLKRLASEAYDKFLEENRLDVPR